MTEEELKNIEAPSAKKPLTERQKKRNTVFLQIGGALLLFAFACVIVPASLIGTKYFFVVVQKSESPLTTLLSVVMFVAIVISWWFSRLICKAIVKRYKTEKFTEDLVKFYLG